MSYIFHTFFYNPFYNLLVWFIDIIPGHDAGIAVVLLTVAVSLVLFSISKKAIKTQLVLKEMEPEMKKIKENIKDKAIQAQAMLDLYKKYDINPFSSFLLVLIQFPILYALYVIFLKSGLPEIQTNILYSFISAPEAVNMNFIGLVDIREKSIVLAVIAGVSQFIQAMIAFPSKPKVEGQVRTLTEDFTHSMHMNMKFVLPVIIGLISASLPSALPLYWSARSLFTAGQEVFVKRSLKK